MADLLLIPLTAAPYLKLTQKENNLKPTKKVNKQKLLTVHEYHLPIFMQTDIFIPFPGFIKGEYKTRRPHPSGHKARCTLGAKLTRDSASVTCNKIPRSRFHPVPQCAEDPL